MTIDNNPLKQYFRRPAVYLKLPSAGKYYKPGVVNIPETGEIPVYPMTAIDEITVKTPDALFNGTAVAEIIKSCIPDVKDPWSINSIDLDALLIAIRSAAGGNDMQVNSQCPKCSEVADYAINLMSILTQLNSGNYEEPLKLGDLTIKFRPLTYKEMNTAGIAQFDVQRLFVALDNESEETIRTQKAQDALKKVTDLTMEILTDAIEYIQTPTVKVDKKEYIMDYLRNCDKNLYVQIRDFNAGLKSQTEIKPLLIECGHCGHKYQQTLTLNTSDFFA